MPPSLIHFSCLLYLPNDHMSLSLIHLSSLFYTHSFVMSPLIHLLCLPLIPLLYVCTHSLVICLHSSTFCVSPLIHLLTISTHSLIVIYLHSFTCYLSPCIHLLVIYLHSFLTCYLSPRIHSLVLYHHSFTHLLSISTHVIGTSHRFPLFHITHTEYVSFRTGDGVAKG